MNERGQYGSRSRVGADGASTGPSPLVLAGIGIGVVALAVLATRAAKRPTLSAHEKEVAAWKEEFPGLPWLADEVKDSRQFDLWERARDHWERTR